MGRPSKPVEIITIEGCSHRTKKELVQREQAEKELLTGVSMKEQASTKKYPVAHKEFARIRGLLRKIGKDDALYQGIINRYCQLVCECEQIEQLRENWSESISKLEARFYDSEDCGLPETEFYALLVKMQNSLIACDKQLQSKRQMLLAIEKENVLTIASALRSIPKKVEDDEQDDPMADMLRRRMELRAKAAGAG